MKTTLKLFGLLTCIILLLIAVRLTLNRTSNDNATLQGDSYPLKVHLQSPTNTYKKSQYVTIEASATNTADYGVQMPWGTCGDTTRVYLDREHEILPLSYAVCDIGWPTLDPGQESKHNNYLLDLSHLESGRHTIQIEVSYGAWAETKTARSNELEFELTAADPIYDCYGHHEYITPLCQPMLISAARDGSVEFNNQICQDIRRALSKHEPTPAIIDSVSTAGCNTGEQANIAFNLPTGSLEYWLYVCDKHESLRGKCTARLYPTSN